LHESSGFELIIFNGIEVHLYRIKPKANEENHPPFLYGYILADQLHASFSGNTTIQNKAIIPGSEGA